MTKQINSEILFFNKQKKYISVRCGCKEFLLLTSLKIADFLTQWKNDIPFKNHRYKKIFFPYKRKK